MNAAPKSRPPRIVKRCTSLLAQIMKSKSDVLFECCWCVFKMPLFKLETCSLWCTCYKKHPNEILIKVVAFFFAHPPCILQFSAFVFWKVTKAVGGHNLQGTHMPTARPALTACLPVGLLINNGVNGQRNLLTGKRKPQDFYQTLTKHCRTKRGCNCTSAEESKCFGWVTGKFWQIPL